MVMQDVRQMMARAIAQRIAKREHGESYEGFESYDGERGEDFADAALAAIDAAGLMRRSLTPKMFQAACKAYNASSWACLDEDALMDAIQAALAAAPKVAP